MFAPLAGLSPAAAVRLTDTLRSWLLHQGRREDVAEELFIHAQTVRYRMAQLRTLYGEQLRDPAVVFDLILALGPPAPGKILVSNEAGTVGSERGRS
jgi:sugar diacid utilization regulator